MSNIDNLNEQWDNYCKEEIEEIKSKLDKGISKEEILMSCKYSYESLEKSGVGVSALIPTKQPQCVYDHWDYSTPNEGKFEYWNSICFGNTSGRDSLLMCLLANAGLEHLLDILPEESIEELRQLLIE